jgi:hypothetical protein
MERGQYPNVSDSGAKLTLATEARLPNEFALLLVPASGVGRRCRIISRSELLVRVKFLQKITVLRPASDRAVLEP